jgi:pimeloyl-ACP methyl ester carboxylesterase
MLDIKGPYILGGWSWAGFFIRTFAGKYPDKVKGLLLVDPAHENAYRRMAMEYPDEFSTIVNDYKNDDPSAIDEFNAGQASFNQAERSDRMHDTPTIVLIATSEKEWAKRELPLKKIWNQELENWARKRPNTTFELVDSGHFIAREKPEVVIKAIRELMLKY